MQIKIGNRTYSLQANKMHVADETIFNIGYAVSKALRNTAQIQNKAIVLRVRRYGNRMHIGLHTRKQLLQKI